MRQEQLPARRGLADLDDRLSEPARRCAQHLRDLRDRAGLTSEALAARLTNDTVRVDKTRLSKFFGGRDVPGPAFPGRIHEVLAEIEGRDVDQDDVARTRDVLYAAACARGPLQAREYELAAAREELQATRLRTTQQLASLRDELDAERAKRQAAEEALVALRGQAQEQAEELRRQRDAAENRVAEVEEAISQTEGLLRLQEQDAHTMAEMSAATEAELLLRGQGEGVATTDPEESFRVMAKWRDYGQDEQADQLLIRLAQGSSIDLLFGLYEQCDRGGRWVDAARVVAATVSHHDPVAVFYFARSLQAEADRQEREARAASRMSPIEALATLQSRPITSADRWPLAVVSTMAKAAPLETVLRFHRLCEENGAIEMARDLRIAVPVDREGQVPTTPAAAEFFKRARREQRDVRRSVTPFLKWFYR